MSSWYKFLFQNLLRVCVSRRMDLLRGPQWPSLPSSLPPPKRLSRSYPLWNLRVFLLLTQQDSFDRVGAALQEWRSCPWRSPLTRWANQFSFFVPFVTPTLRTQPQISPFDFALKQKTSGAPGPASPGRQQQRAWSWEGVVAFRWGSPRALSCRRELGLLHTGSLASCSQSGSRNNQQRQVGMPEQSSGNVFKWSVSLGSGRDMSKCSTAGICLERLASVL